MIPATSSGTGEHIPVMLPQVISYLNIHPNGVYLDGTVGLGGHAKAILSSLNGTGRVIGIDRDEEALEVCRRTIPASSPVALFHGRYDQFPAYLSEMGIQTVSGMLLDLGLSSLQLDSPSRGFSYRNDGPLDMRFDTTSGLSAADLIPRLSESELADILFQYGEERQSRRIARTIKAMGNLQTIADLNEAVRRSTPPAQRHKTLTRVFQALRISVNQELEHLVNFLASFIDYLEIGGHLVVLSYHSLEDRLIKVRFKELSKIGAVSILTRKPLQPDADEIQSNPRARSAKLRVLERIL